MVSVARVHEVSAAALVITERSAPCNGRDGAPGTMTDFNYGTGSVLTQRPVARGFTPRCIMLA